jgi:hypothetical protein
MPNLPAYVLQRTIFFGLGQGVDEESARIAGDIILPAGMTPSGTLHIDNATCFDPLISGSLAGALSPDTTSLVVTGSDGQVVTLIGSFTNLTYNVMVNGTIFTTFTGTYKVDGGCAAGDHGTVTGAYVYSIGPEYDPFPWSGTFTSSSTQQMLHATGTIVESTNADAASSFGIGGGATFDNACLSAGTMKTGMYPSASFILGTSVTIEFDSSSGILNLSAHWTRTQMRLAGTTVSPVAAVIRVAAQ